MFGSSFFCKYNINNFYVGELYITEELDDEYDRECFEKYNHHSSLVVNGAIDLQIGKYQIEENREVNFYKVLTIFYKTYDGYLCLHDNKLYDVDTKDFVNNVTSLSNLLPKVGYNVPRFVGCDRALEMFLLLFDNSILLDNIYNDAKYNIDDFYIGTLVLNTEILLDGMKNKCKQVNVISKSILNKGSRIVSLSSKSLRKAGFSLDRMASDKYKFIHYECLFLKTKMGLYNVNDFQIYNNNDLEGIVSSSKIDESEVHDLRPITDRVSDLKEKRVSIPKVLKRIRSI